MSPRSARPAPSRSPCAGRATSTASTGIVIPGGESTTIGKLLVTFELLEPLRAAVAAGLPAYGSCAGMILLADRVLDAPPDQVGLGGIDMTVRRNAFGRQVDSFEGPVQFAGVGGDRRGVHPGAVGGAVGVGGRGAGAGRG